MQLLTSTAKTLIEEDIVAILKSYDAIFQKVISITQWADPYYTTAYTINYEDSSKTVHGITLEITTKENYDCQCKILDIIRSSSSSTNPIPVPSPILYDESQKVVPHQYALFKHPPGTFLSLLVNDSDLSTDLSDSSSISSTLHSEQQGGVRSPAELARIECHVGAYLRTLHDNILNEWYGESWAPKEWGECISWQEAFSLMLESALDAFEALNLNNFDEQRSVIASVSTDTPDTTGDTMPGPSAFSVPDLRKLLGRAIGYYLFDDVEVPSLIWCATLPLLSSTTPSTHPALSPSLSGSTESKVISTPLSTSPSGISAKTKTNTRTRTGIKIIPIEKSDWRSRVLVDPTTSEVICFLGWGHGGVSGNDPDSETGIGLGFGPLWGDPLMEGIFSNVPRSFTSTTSNTTTTTTGAVTATATSTSTTASPTPSNPTGPSVATTNPTNSESTTLPNTSPSTRLSNPAYPTIHIHSSVASLSNNSADTINPEKSSHKTTIGNVEEGYGSSPIIFSRQNTKLMWYEVYRALLDVLWSHGAITSLADSCESPTTGTASGEREEEENRNKLKLLKDMFDCSRRRLAEIAEKLKDAPCY